MQLHTHCSRATLSLLKNGADLHTVTELTWKKYYTNVICTDRGQSVRHLDHRGLHQPQKYLATDKDLYS